MENTMRRKIGYDARMIEHSGIGVRIQHILKLWPLSESEAELFVFGDPILLKKHRLPSHAQIIEYHAGIYSLKELVGHPKMKEMDFLDIPHFNVPIFKLSKSIVTIHDLIPFHFKQAHRSLFKRLYLHTILRLIAWFAYKVICVSNFTKNDFTQYFYHRSDEISVIYNGIDPDVFSPKGQENLADFRSKHFLPKEFLLTIGIGKKHKNFGFLIKNLSYLWKQKSLKLPLVIGGLGKEIPREIQDFKDQFPEQIILLKHLPYEALPQVYRSAKLFLFPSLFEGFGFPVLEAQASGTPVLSSDATVLPEILKESAALFDARDDSDFQKKLIQLLADRNAMSHYEKAGLANAKSFHWQDQLQNLRNFYLKILAQK